jgi:ferritin-like metal-binding protein YciE
MPMTVSNPRDLFVMLLGEILYVERRLAGGVLQSLIDSVNDEALKSNLRKHLEETHRHVERAEMIFRQIDVAPSAHFSAAFEAAVKQHDDAAPTIRNVVLRDCFHGQAALHTEHWEIAAYTSALLAAKDAGLDDEGTALMRETLRDEQAERDRIEPFLGDLISTRDGS